MERTALQKVMAERFAEVSRDIVEIVSTGRYPVVVLLRGYGLLELAQDFFTGKDGADGEVADERIQQELEGVLSEYKKVYEEYGQRLMQVLDRNEIALKAEAYMRPWQRKFEKANGEYEKAVELWEAAKAAHKAQEEGGFFEKLRTLRAVRKMAGFRLERRRTGNFVARTLELMQQARFEAREAELMMYGHNVGYKCNPELYGKIYELVCDNLI